MQVLYAYDDSFDVDEALAEQGIEPGPDDQVFVVRFAKVSPQGGP